MTTETIIANTKQMIDDLKTVCANFGLGNASSEYKIITEIFLYKFLNDKFLYEVQQAEESLKDSSHFNVLLEQVKKLYFPFGDEKFASSFPVTILVKADAIVL